MNVKTATVCVFAFNTGGLQISVKGFPDLCVIMRKNPLGWLDIVSVDLFFE